MFLIRLGKKLNFTLRSFYFLVLFWCNYLFISPRLRLHFKERRFVLFFLPELAVGLYSSMLATVAQRIRNSGYEPVFFGCNSFLNNCMLQDRLSGHSALLKNIFICSGCNSKLSMFVNNYNFSYLLAKPSFNLVLQFSSNSVEERLNFSYKKIPVGRLAYYDLSIKFKRERDRIELTQDEITYYDGAIFDCCRIINLLDENQSLLRLNSVLAIDEYSLSNVVREWARINSISAFRAGFSYHFNADPEFVTLSSSLTRAGEKFNRLSQWQRWRDIPLPAPLIDEIALDLIFRMSGSGGHIFSTNYTGNLVQLLVRFGFHPEVKTFVVFISADDELNALTELSYSFGEYFHVEDAFGNQIEWLKSIILYAFNNNVQVIIKLHPRLVHTHRDSGQAENLHIYRELEETSPSNVAFIWPDSKVSAYDVLHLADLCLTSWGSMGLEAAKLGVPVVSCITKITSVTPGLPLFKKARTEAEFYRLLDEPKKSICVEDLAESYRWHHLLHMAGSIILNSNRDLRLYGLAFDFDFADVLSGTLIEEKKFDYLSLIAKRDPSSVIYNESNAILAANQKLIDFFFQHTHDLSESKLLSRLYTMRSTV